MFHGDEKIDDYQSIQLKAFMSKDLEEMVEDN